MLKSVFWGLLAGNILLLIFLVMDERQTGLSIDIKARAPLNADQVVLLGIPLPESAIPILPASIPVSEPETSAAAVCLRWGEFSGAALEGAEAVLKRLQLDGAAQRSEVEHAGTYWVYMPPLKDKAALNAKIAQLKARGVTDYYVVKEPDPMASAISLGVFTTREGAENWLAELRKRDVRTARVDERYGKQKAVVFELSGINEEENTLLQTASRDFPGSTLQNVPCVR